MQATKAKVRSLEAPRRKSYSTPGAIRQGKPQGSDSDSVSTPTHAANRTPKETAFKTGENKSSLSPASEKRRSGRVSDAESLIVQLQEELKKAKEQLKTSESLKWQVEQETEETNRQLMAMSSDLNESRKYLFELLASEDDRIRELRKISQDRDRAWQCELEAVRKQHSMDSSALASAMNEIQKLKLQLEKVRVSENTQSKRSEYAYAEIESLRIELEETLDLVENLRAELSDCRDSEAQNMEVPSKTQMELETANATIETLHSNRLKAMKAINSLSFELEQSKDQVKSLEGLVSELQADLDNSMNKNLEVDSANTNVAEENQEKNEKINQLQAELDSLRSEASQLRSALDAGELRYQEENIIMTLQIGNAYDQIDFTKAEACRKEAELKTELAKAMAQIAQFIDKETHLPDDPQVNEGDSDLIKELQVGVEELKAILLDKETELQSVTEKNEKLRIEMEEEIEKNVIKDQVSNQLNAAQAANLEMESDLRRVKVQLDQWRKAAELAASMLSDGNDGKLIARTSSFDINYSIGSPYTNDLEDDSPKKKNANMLKKIGVLWKKGQK